MKKKTVSILHPFTPQAVGLDEMNFLGFHSQPHYKAAKMLMDEGEVEILFDYFTSRRKGYTKQIGGILYRFYPVSRKWNGDHLKWKKQSSKVCLNDYKKNSPDVTIINMSGHSSPFSYELSKIILANKKQYIGMLGGQHYSDNERNRLYYNWANHLLVHTQIQKNSMEQMDLFKGSDIKIFPLGVDTEVFKPVEKNYTPPSLLYVGRIIPLKRIHLAIQSVKQLKEKIHPDIHLKIIGPIGSTAYLNQLQDLVKDLRLERNVSFLGTKQHSELPPYYQNADILVLPSDKETFGMVMIEAMACGTPVAGMDCAVGPLEVIRNGYDGILSTPETFADNIVYYFQNSHIAQKLSSNARDKVLKDYGITSTFNVLKHSISSIIAN